MLSRTGHEGALAGLIVPRVGEEAPLPGGSSWAQAGKGRPLAPGARLVPKTGLAQPTAHRGPVFSFALCPNRIIIIAPLHAQADECGCERRQTKKE